MPDQPTIPPCPKCGSNKRSAPRGEWWYCHNCDCLYDGEPEEGGDYSTRDPSWRMQRAERKKKAR